MLFIKRLHVVATGSLAEARVCGNLRKPCIRESPFRDQGLDSKVPHREQIVNIRSCRRDVIGEPRPEKAATRKYLEILMKCGRLRTIRPTYRICMAFDVCRNTCCDESMMFWYVRIPQLAWAEDGQRGGQWEHETTLRISRSLVRALWQPRT